MPFNSLPNAPLPQTRLDHFAIEAKIKNRRACAEQDLIGIQLHLDLSSVSHLEVLVTVNGYFRIMRKHIDITTLETPKEVKAFISGYAAALDSIIW